MNTTDMTGHATRGSEPLQVVKFMVSEIDIVSIEDRPTMRLASALNLLGAVQLDVPTFEKASLSDEEIVITPAFKQEIAESEYKPGIAIDTQTPLGVGEWVGHRIFDAMASAEGYSEFSTMVIDPNYADRASTYRRLRNGAVVNQIQGYLEPLLQWDEIMRGYGETDPERPNDPMVVACFNALDAVLRADAHTVSDSIIAELSRDGLYPLEVEPTDHRPQVVAQLEDFKRDTARQL